MSKPSKPLKAAAKALDAGAWGTLSVKQRAFDEKLWEELMENRRRLALVGASACILAFLDEASKIHIPRGYCSTCIKYLKRLARGGE